MSQGEIRSRWTAEVERQSEYIRDKSTSGVERKFRSGQSDREGDLRLDGNPLFSFLERLGAMVR